MGLAIGLGVGLSRGEGLSAGGETVMVGVAGLLLDVATGVELEHATTIRPAKAIVIALMRFSTD